MKNERADHQKIKQLIENSKGVWLVRVESRKNDKRKSFSKQIRGIKRDAERFLIK